MPIREQFNRENYADPGVAIRKNWNSYIILCGHHMILIHRSHERGTFRNAWLDARFSFEFGSYRNASRGPYSDLLVLNDDMVAPGHGFATHGHDNVEVLSFPLTGRVVHRDSLGNHETLSYGDVHLMRAGSGILHSEMNASDTDHEHHVQWWIAPAHRNTQPGYEKKHFSPEDKTDRLCLIASPNGEAGSLSIDQDVRIYASIIGVKPLECTLDPQRRGYLHVLGGSLHVNGEELEAGDGAQLEQVAHLRLQATESSEILLFDLR